MKAIETRYKGYRFRSRLEARWAVFFDAMQWQWEYEPEGYHLPDGQMYLPDFYLPDHEALVEIKPSNGNRSQVMNQLIGLIEIQAVASWKAWGFFGDPLDHQWMQIGYDEKSKKYINEWADDAAISEYRYEEPECSGNIIKRVGPTFSLSTVERLERTEFFPKASDCIDNYKEKCAARAARFEHGECG